METLPPAQSIYEIDVKESLVIGVREVTAVDIEGNLTNLMKDGNTHGIVDEIVEYDVELEDHAIEDVSRPPLILRRTTKGNGIEDQAEKDELFDQLAALNDERREERDKIRDKYKGQELDARLQQLNANIEARKQEIKERIAELNES